MLRALILLTRKRHNIIKHSFNENMKELDYLLISYWNWNVLHFPHSAFSTPRTPHPALRVFHRTVNFHTLKRLSDFLSVYMSLLTTTFPNIHWPTKAIFVKGSIFIPHIWFWESVVLHFHSETLWMFYCGFISHLIDWLHVLSCHCKISILILFWLPKGNHSMFSAHILTTWYCKYILW